MKETTGELNMTIIVVVAISVLVAFFYYVIWPSLDANFEANSSCSKAICKNPCGEGSGKNSCPDMEKGLVECHAPGKDEPTFYCPWKG